MGHERFRIQEISVHQTGKQHSHQHHPICRIPHHFLKSGRRHRRQERTTGCDFLILRYFPLHAAPQGGLLAGIRPRPAVRKPCMMTGNTESPCQGCRPQLLLMIPQKPGPRRGMIAAPFLLPSYICLKRRTVLSQIMILPQKYACILHAERLCKQPRQPCRLRQMIFQPLNTFFIQMPDKFVHAVPLMSIKNL